MIRPHHVAVRVVVERSVDSCSEASAASVAKEVVEEFSRRLPGLAAIEVVSVRPVERRRAERRGSG